MTTTPSRIAAEHDIARDFAECDDVFIQAEVSRLPAYVRAAQALVVDSVGS